MLSDARDFAISMWVVMQGLSWLMPDAYGNFKAHEENTYIETMDKLGVWEE